jgi:alkaline phosphatase
LQYANGPGATTDGKRHELDLATERLVEVPTLMKGHRTDLTAVDTTSPRYEQEAEVPLPSETHGGEDVPIYANGPKAYLVHGALEQNAIYHVMAEALGYAKEGSEIVSESETILSRSALTTYYLTILLIHCVNSLTANIGRKHD